MSPRRQRGEGSIFKRGDGRWCATLDISPPKGQGPRRRKTVYAKPNTQRAAVDALTALKLEHARHGHTPPAAPTVENWLRTWLTDIAPERVRPTTLPGYRSKVERYLIPAIGRHRLDRLAPEHLRATYREMRSRGLAETTVRQTHQILSRALKVAVREGRVTRNVAELVDAPGTKTKKPDPPNPTEVAAIFEALAGDRLESRWLAALLLGMRQGESLALGWDWVDLAAGSIRVDRALARVPGRGLLMVPVKSEASEREIPLPGLLWRSLQLRRLAYEAEREAPGYADLGLVWAQPSGRPVDPRADWQAWTDLLDRAGVGHHRLHDARHVAASALAALGVPVEVRMQILGHSQVSMALHYTHVDEGPMREAMALVDQAHRAIAQ